VSFFFAAVDVRSVHETNWAKYFLQGPVSWEHDARGNCLLDRYPARVGCVMVCSSFFGLWMMAGAYAKLDKDGPGSVNFPWSPPGIGWTYLMAVLAMLAGGAPGVEIATHMWPIYEKYPRLRKLLWELRIWGLFSIPLLLFVLAYIPSWYSRLHPVARLEREADRIQAKQAFEILSRDADKLDQALRWAEKNIDNSDETRARRARFFLKIRRETAPQETAPPKAYGPILKLNRETSRVRRSLEWQRDGFAFGSSGSPMTRVAHVQEDVAEGPSMRHSDPQKNGMRVRLIGESVAAVQFGYEFTISRIPRSIS
jgi:hypothetical protein